MRLTPEREAEICKMLNAVNMLHAEILEEMRALRADKEGLKSFQQGLVLLASDSLKKERDEARENSNQWELYANSLLRENQTLKKTLSTEWDELTKLRVRMGRLMLYISSRILPDDKDHEWSDLLNEYLQEKDPQ